ncbi:translation initiation factor IF-2-like [Panicum virgatum]|uniref:translation initiation factor IF-2-like n=1 Tax=Panicum virgatum TaxID=38727 RepID=UPI0019D61124|nr:translation initiation factor IF-2-like [Panicum virgatum]
MGLRPRACRRSHAARGAQLAVRSPPLTRRPRGSGGALAAAPTAPARQALLAAAQKLARPAVLVCRVPDRGHTAKHGLCLVERPPPTPPATVAPTPPATVAPTPPAGACSPRLPRRRRRALLAAGATPAPTLPAGHGRAKPAAPTPMPPVTLARPVPT